MRGEAGPAKGRTGKLLAVAAVGAILLLERRRPLRRFERPEALRVPRNLALGALSIATTAVLQKPLAEPLAQLVERRRWGLIQRLPKALRAPVALLLFDYSMYLWHRLTHVVPALWRLHVVHHIERDMDATTALRFHPADMAVSVPWRLAQVALIGAGPRELRLGQRLFFASVLFHHSNLRLPAGLERRLEPFLVTPRMHGIHHVPTPAETGSNWSSGLSIWDRLHGTLRRGSATAAGRTGVPGYPLATDARLGLAMRLPFMRQRDAWQQPSGADPA